MTIIESRRPTWQRLRAPGFRWWPNRWFILLFFLPIASFALYAIATSTELYELEVRVTADRPTVLQVYYDPGTGLSALSSAAIEVPVTPKPVAVRLPIPVTRIAAIHFNLALHPGIMRVSAVTIRTKVAVWAQRHVRFTFDLAAAQVPTTQKGMDEDGTPTLRLEKEEAPPDADFDLTPPVPINVGVAWFYAGMRFVRFVVGWFLLWILCAECLRLVSSRTGRSSALLAWRPSPALAIWILAGASVVLSCYPVIFCGKSFTGSNFTDGTFQLYDTFPTLPGTTDTEMESGHGADLGALAWAHGPYAAVQHRAIFRDGELPLWNRYNEVGLPLLGQGQSMFGDPLHFIVVCAGGRAWGWDVKFILAKWVFAAGVGLLVLAATDFLPAALLLSFSAAFLGFFAYRLNHPAYFSVCYAPWILFTWVRVVRSLDWRGAMRWAVGLVLANWVELNSGTAKEAYMLLAGLNGTGVLMLVSCRLHWKPKLARLAGLAAAGVVFLLLASPFLLAFFDTLQKSATGYDNPLAFQLQPSLLIGLFDDIFYRQFNAGEAVLDPSLNLFVGLGVLLAIGGAHRLLRDRVFVAVAVSTVPPLALVFAVVPPGFIRTLPFLGNVYHVDNTFSCILLIQFLLLAGYGIRHALTVPARSWRHDAAISLAVGLVLLGGYFGAVNAVQRSSVLFHPAEELVFSNFFCGYVPVVLLAAILVVPILRHLYRQRPQVLPVLAGLVCLAALHWRMGLHSHSAFSRYTAVLPNRMDLFADSPAMDRLRADTSSPFRAFGIGNVFARGHGAMMDIESITGVDAIYNPYVQSLSDAVPDAAQDRFLEPGSAQSLTAGKRLYDLLGVRYFLTMPGRPLPDLPGVTLAARLDLDVYRNEDAWPRAFFVDRLGVYHGLPELVARLISGDGQPFAEIDGSVLPDQEKLRGRFPADQIGREVVTATRYRLTNHRTFFDIDAPAAGIVVLTEPFVDKDIEATVNGKPTPVFRVNHAFRALVVDGPGVYHIVVDYEPRGFTLALWAFVLGGLLLGLAAWRLFRHGPGELRGSTGRC